MHKQRLAILIGSVLGIISTFLPWVNVPFIGSIDGTAGDGWITLIIFVVPLVISLLGNRKSPVISKIKYINVTAGLLLAGIGIWKIIGFKSVMNQTGGGLFDSLKSSISIGFGLYLLIIAGISVAIISFIPKLFGGVPDSIENEQESVQERKSNIYCRKCGNEINDDASHCNNCGSRVNLSIENFLKIVKSYLINFKLNKKIVIISVLGIVVIIAIIGLFTLTNTPIKRLQSAINNSKDVEAVAIYNDNIKGNQDKEAEVASLFKTKIDNIKKDFVDNKITYDSAVSQLELLEKLGIISSDVQLAKSNINALNDSRTSFSKGNDYLKNNNYKDAIEWLNKVIKEDGNYSKAQDLIKGSINNYKTTILNEVQKAAQSTDFNLAVSLLSQALIIIPNDSDLMAGKDDYQKKNIEHLKNKQELIVEKASIIVQSDVYKSLYPDMIQVIVPNKTQKTIKNMEVSCLAFDKNNLPIKIQTEFSFRDASFEFVGYADNVNIIPNSTYGNNKGWNLNKNHGIKIILACVKNVEYYDGSTWNNPYYDFWLNEYKEKPLH